MNSVDAFRPVSRPVTCVMPPSGSHEPAPLSGEPATPRKSGRSLTGVRILVVDDDQDARELLDAMLTYLGGTVLATASAAEAFARLADFAPNVIVSDIGMPFEDGYSLIQRIRALGPAHGGDVPALALTAYTRAEDRAKALAAGFTMHAGKPMHPDDLVSAVRQLAALR